MKPLPSFALLTLTAALVACGPGGGGVTAPPPPTPAPAPSPAVCAQAAALPADSTPGAGLGTLSVTGPMTADWTAPHVPGRVLVVGGGSDLSAQALGTLNTLRTQNVLPGLKLAFTPTGETDAAFAHRLERTGLKVQPDYLYRTLAPVVNDPGYPGNRGFLVGTTAVVQSYLPRIRAEDAWLFLKGCGKTPTAALTAVLDSGVDATHEDLRGRLLTGRSFVGTAVNVDERGHGTATAGLLGASTNNGVGLAGVTWTGQNILPLKVLDETGSGSTSTLAQAVDYAVTQHAKVINMSLGLPLGNTTDKTLDAALSRAADSAVLIAAAGNTPGEGLYYPASHPKVIAVGAVGAQDGALACYSARPTSQFPRVLDIVAPGGLGDCPGATNAQQLLVLSPGNEYAVGAGTSYAAPLVSGVAALMRAANPGLSAAETRARLLASVNTASGQRLLDANAAVRAATR